MVKNDLMYKKLKNNINIVGFKETYFLEKSINDNIVNEFVITDNLKNDKVYFLQNDSGNFKIELRKIKSTISDYYVHDLTIKENVERYLVKYENAGAILNNTINLILTNTSNGIPNFYIDDQFLNGVDLTLLGVIRIYDVSQFDGFTNTEYNVFINRKNDTNTFIKNLFIQESLLTFYTLKLYDIN
jgi:hypothetical protein